MKETIIQLWRGNLAPVEAFGKDAEYRVRLQQLSQEEKTLMDALDDRCRPLLEKCDECRTAMNARGEELIFSIGFRLGVRLLWEALAEDKA